MTNAPRPDRVVHPAPTDIRPWDFLWSITAWSRELLAGTPRLEERLGRLHLTDAMLKRLDPYSRPYLRVEQRSLATGALFIQYRWIFGSETRGERAALDTPLAKQAGLRSTNLLFRA